MPELHPDIQMGENRPQPAAPTFPTAVRKILAFSQHGQSANAVKTINIVAVAEIAVSVVAVGRTKNFTAETGNELLPQGINSLQLQVRGAALIVGMKIIAQTATCRPRGFGTAVNDGQRKQPVVLLQPADAKLHQTLCRSCQPAAKAHPEQQTILQRPSFLGISSSRTRTSARCTSAQCRQLTSTTAMLQVGNLGTRKSASSHTNKCIAGL